MNEVIKMGRKAVTAAVVAATIAWSVSLSAFLAPLAAQAAVSGTLVKASLPAVYYVGQDGKRYVFPNEKTYKTWYADFSSVVTITDSELAAMPIGGNATYKPGVLMVKITTDPKVYAVDAHGTLRWVNSEALATALYGSNWNQRIQDVPDAFFTNYTVGSDIVAASSFSPASVSAAATSINSDKNLSAVVAAGAVSVTMSSSPAVGGTLPMSATGVNMVKFDVKNSGSSAVTVDSLTVHRSGAGAAADIANVYVYDGMNRLTTGRSVNSSTNDATFSGLGLSIAAGATSNLWIAADVAASGTALAGNQDMLSVTGLLAGGTSATGLPLNGPLFSIAGSSVGTATVASSGTISNVKAGGLQQKVAEFSVTAPSAEDMDFQSIALYYSGTSSRSNLTNFTLKQAGTTVATASGISAKDLVTFTLSTPMYMERGAVRTFQVYADLNGSARSTETLAIGLDQTTDFHGMGRTYGFGVAATDSYAQISVTIEAGRFTTTFNGPAAKDVASNAKDVELFNFTVAAQSNLEVRRTEMVVTVDTAANCALIDDFKIVDVATGAVVAGPSDLANIGADVTCENSASDTELVAFTETWNMSAGQSRTFKVTADIDSTFPAAGTIQISLGDGGDLFDTDAVRNLDNNTYLTASNNDFVPAVSVPGNTNTIRIPSLTLAIASTPVTQTYIQGTQNAQMMGFTVKASDAGDIKLNTLVLTGYIDDDTSGAFTAGTSGAAVLVNEVLTSKLMVGSTQVGATKSPTSAGVITFDNLNLTIPSGQTVSFVLTASIAGSISNLSDRIKFDIVNDADVTATDKDGNALSAAASILGPDADGINTTTVDSGVRMTIASAGTVSAVLAPNDAESEAGILVGGASNAVLAKYKFNAVNEELRLAKARVNIATASTVTSVSLYDGSTLVGGPVSVDGSGNADFSGMTLFVIPKDGSKVLTIKGNLGAVGSTGATSGSTATATLKNTATTLEIRGTSSGSSTLITTYTEVGGNAKVVRRSKPTISLVALPTTILASGEQTMARVNVSADAAGDVSLKRLTAQLDFALPTTTTVASGDIATSGARRVGDSANVAGVSSILDAGGAACTGADLTCYMSVDFSNEEVIAAGTSRTYDLRITLGVAAPVSGNSFSTKLLARLPVITSFNAVAEVAQVSTGYLALDDDATAVARPHWGIDLLDNSTGAGMQSAMIWSDNSATSHAADSGNDDDGTAAFSSTADWTNGYYVKVLPTDTQTMSK